jgi:hypothetical protein
MKNDILVSLRRLSDAALVAGLENSLTRERDETASVVAHLAELDTRDVHLREGYTSLFVYCRDALGMSEGEAYNRIEVARTARRFPVVLDMLADGRLHLTAARLLGPHLTLDNHCEVLGSARGKTKLEIQEIVARLSPRPDVPASVRRLPARHPERSPQAAMPVLPAPLVSPAPATVPPAVSAIGTVEPTRVVHAAVTPLSPDRYKLQVTIGGETLEKLRCAQDMLGHAIPSGDAAAVLDRALTSLLVELAKKKFAQAAKPRASRATKRESVSAAVRRAVWVRDRGRCTFIGSGGHRCDERRFIEFHHLDPKALGGEASVDNIELRCRRHNDYEGRLWFGKRRRSRELVPEQVGSNVTPASP